MKHQIRENPVGLVEFTMDKGEKVVAESGAMVYYTDNITTHTRTRKGGFLKHLKTYALGGESFWVNEFTADSDNAQLGITGKALGNIDVIHIDQEYIIQSGAYIANTGDMTLDTKWQGFVKGIFGTNLFMLKTIGTGDVFLNSWGGIITKTLEPGEIFHVDNYQLVGFPSTVQYTVTKHAGWKTTLFGGETLIVKLIGPGDVMIQTKNVTEMVKAIIPFLPTK